MQILKLAFILILVPPVYASDPGAVDNLAEVVAVRTAAVAEKREPPRYPIKALRSGTEGWVVTSFTITENGTTDDITIRQASIDGFFEKESIRAVRDWTYSPATLNGKPVSQSNRHARHVYRITNQPEGVSPGFHRQYKATLEAIKDGDLDQASGLLEKLDSNKKRLLAEVFFLDVLHSAYWQSKGDKKKNLRYTERALIIADEVAQPGMYINLLRQAIAANTIAGHYPRVLKHYKTLLEVDENLAPEDPVHEYVTQVNQIIGGDKVIAVEGKLSLCKHCKPVRSSWRRSLNRKSFSIDQVAGEINLVEVICDLQMVSLNYDPQTVFHIKTGWEACDVRLIGEQGTTFRLVEHPENEATGSAN